ncbi:MAG: hypothetical protein OJF49_001236 [Ktedonobacterales bacterium]|jgi:hypothetical protein|nr:MAG: hypothetical protein OJF49_001236 [Ktedonobacterales bacterium]
MEVTRRRAHRARHLLAVVLLALAACALLMLGGQLRSAPIAHGHALQPQDSPTATPTTPSPTDTPVPTSTPNPGQLTLVSPSSAAGPAGAHITLSGSGFSGSSVAVFASNQANCGSNKKSLASIGLSGGAFTNASFVWPAFPSGRYYICAPGMSSGAPSYQEMTDKSPTLSLSTSSVQQGSLLTITGTNFVGLPGGSQIMLQASQGATQTALSPNAVVGGDGSFSLPWTVNIPATGNILITAMSAPEGTAQPVLQASVSLTIGVAATATITVTESPTVAPTAATGIGGQTDHTKGSGGGALLLLVAVIVFLLLAILGIVAFLMLRGRNPQDPQHGSDPGYGGYGGYGGSGPYGAMPTGRYSAPGQAAQYGQTGFYGAPDPYAGASVGAVSQWDSTQEQPGPDWQPRPMTGYQQPYDQPGYGPPDYQQPGWDATGAYTGAYPPADPWANPQAGYTGQQGYADPQAGYTGQQGYADYNGYGGQPGYGDPSAYGAQQGYGAPQAYPPSYDDGGGTTNAAGWSGYPPAGNPGQPGGQRDQHPRGAGGQQGGNPDEFGPWPDLNDGSTRGAGEW